MDLPLHVSDHATVDNISEEGTYASAHNIIVALALYTLLSRTSLAINRYLRRTRRSHDVHAVLPGVGLPDFRQHLCVFSGRLAYFLSSNGVDIDASSSSDDDDSSSMDVSPII
jgi:hypothetical protein